MKNKIVVSGVGVYTSIGKNKRELIDSLLSARSGINEIDEFETTGFRNSIKDINETESTTGTRSSLLLIHSVEQAIIDSCLFDTPVNRSRVSISVGSSLGGMDGYVDWIFTTYENNKYNTVLEAV